MSGRLRLAGLLVAGLLASSAVAQVSQFTPGSVASSGPVTLTGDVAGTGTGTVPTTITALPLSKLATISANSLLGNNTGSPATASALTTAQTKTLLAIANTDVSGLGTASTAATGTSGHTIPYLDGNNTFSGTNAFAGITPTTVTASGLVTGAGLKTSTANIYRADGANIIQASTADSITNFYATGSGNFIFWNSGSSGALMQIANSGDMSVTGNVSAANLTSGGFPASVASGTIIGRSTAGTGAASALTVLPTATMPALTGDVTNSAGSLATTLATNVVTYAKFQQVAASSLVGNATGSLANATGITLAGGLTFSGSTLTAAGALTPTSVASTGAVSGTTVAGTSSILSSGATAGVGYATGAGGTVTQITSRSTGVTLNKACGAITLVSAAGSATAASFTVTDSAVVATDVIIVNQKSGTDKYLTEITNIGAGTFVITSQTTGGTTTEQPVFNFCVVKGVSA